MDPSPWADFPTWAYPVTTVLSGRQWAVLLDLTCVSSLTANLLHCRRPAAGMDLWLTRAAAPGLALLGEGGMGLAVPW